MDYLASLNPEQQAAAKHTEGAVLVSAGAGSGKTRLLTHRIAHIIDKGTRPQNILAITFTNKAASVMRERLIDLGCDISYAWIMTFHAMCARILRAHIDRLGYNSNFVIYDDTDKERVLKNILEDYGFDKDDWLKALKEMISGIKSSNAKPGEFFSEFSRDKAQKLESVYNDYDRVLKESNALDFDDLLKVTYNLLSLNEDIREHYRQKFRYVSVDEFQDTNDIQYELIKLLVPQGGNIFAVGDENQSIYGWRYAKMENMQKFAQYYNATIYKLERNYRSTQEILDAANKLIKFNNSFIEKNLWTENKGGVKIERYAAYDERGEAEYVAEKIYELHRRNDIPYGDMAVLLRVNALTRSFEEAFLNYNIPYKVFGGMKFYDRKEIKDILAYMRLIVNPYDSEALRRIINFPKRGIGETTVKKLFAVAAANRIPAYEALKNSGHYLKDLSGQKKLADFYALIEDLRAYPISKSLVQSAQYIIKTTKMIEEYSGEDTESINRLLNINEFLSTIDTFEQNNAGAAITDYLQSVSLISDIDDMQEGDFVNLATVHSAKGMEFHTVFISGLEEGLFPISRAKNSAWELEEERRLMYVAITRAKQRLYMTYAKSRFLYGKRASNIKSRFISESDVYESERVFAAQPVYRNLSLSESKPLPDFSPKKNYDERLKNVGTKVNHKVFGQGNIIEVQNINNNVMVKVKFLSVGVKNLMLDFAPLEVVE